MKTFEKLNKNEMKMIVGGGLDATLEGGSENLGTCKAKCRAGSVECEGSSCTATDADKYSDGYCSAGGKTRWC
jgi:hypothetical protein